MGINRGATGFVACILAALTGCGAAAPPPPDVARQAASLVSVGAGDAEKAAAGQFLALQILYENKLIPEARAAAQSIVGAADLAALQVDGIDCLQWLSLQDVSFEVVTDYVAERPRRARDSCTIEQPVRLDEQVGPVRFSRDDMLMSCELARSMVRFARILESHGITEVDIGTPFSCRTMRRRRHVSQHAHGAALDVGAVRTASGQEYEIEEWERRDDTPESDGGRLWYDIVQQLHAERVFNIILTPNYDRAHRHWLHLDLTPDQHLLR